MPPHIELLIDSREKIQFIGQLKSACNIPEIIINVLQLNIGDIQINFNGEKTVVIERKTINDLASSLSVNKTTRVSRYHEQKGRLKAGLRSSRIIYLIEGSYEELSGYNKTFTYDKYRGCIVNTLVRDNIPVYQTKDMEETCEFVKDICKRLGKYGTDILKEYCDDKKGGDSYVDTIKLSKRENNNCGVAYINQLRQIPGISLNIAKALAEKYPSMHSLISAYENIRNNADAEEAGKLCEKEVKDIVVGGRRIGPVVSKRLYQYLFNIVEI